jgi:hypothetical protein
MKGSRGKTITIFRNAQKKTEMKTGVKRYKSREGNKIQGRNIQQWMSWLKEKMHDKW